MPTAKANPTTDLATHDVTLSNGAERIGLQFRDGPKILQEIPISEGAAQFSREQKAWFGGGGKLRYEEDPTGYWDAYGMWTMTDGKLFPAPQWRYGSGYRSHNTLMPGSVTYQKIEKYVSQSFVASANYSADKVMMWLDWRGSPGALTYSIYTDDGGSPSLTELITGTISTSGATRYGPSGCNWTGVQALTSGTTYHIRLYYASTTASSYWMVGSNLSASTVAKTSSSGSSWTAASYGLYYRMIDIDTKRQFKLFDYLDAKYAVAINDAATASTLYINGDRFKATSATSTTVTNTSSGVSTGWTNEQWIGAYVRIIKGTGAGQVRAITDNDSTSLTVATWDVTPDTTSECVIYATDIWQPITSGLGVVTGAPAVFSSAVYFPQGATIMRVMSLDYTNALQHAFINEIDSHIADLVAAYHNPTTQTELWRAFVNTPTVSYATWDTSAPSGAGHLTWSAEKMVGSNSRITNLLGGQELVIFKDDSFWSASPNHTILPQYTGLASAVDPSNGKAAMYYNNEMWFSWAHSLQRLTLGTDDISDMLLYRSGTQGLVRPGVPSDGVAGVGWRFFAIDGEGTKTSSVIVYNGYGWSEVFRGWNTTSRIRNISWQSCPGTRSRLWIDVNGELVYVEFPLYAANPRRDTGLSYQHYSEFETSTFDMNEVTMYKLLSLVKVTLESASASSILVEYQYDGDIGSTTWYSLGELLNVQHQDFSLDLGQIQQFRLKFRIYTTTSTSPPVINAYEVGGWRFSPLKYQWVSSFKVDSNQITKTGDPDFSPNDIVEFLQTASERGVSIALRSVIPTMDDKKVIVSAPVIHKEWNRAEDGKATWGGSVDIAFREV